MNYLRDWIVALTLKQPVASAMIDGYKTYETRDFKPVNFVGFALHAGKSDNYHYQSAMERLIPGYPGLESLPRGILGIIRIVEVHDLHEYFDYSQLSEFDNALGNWKARYAWKIEVVNVFDRPVPARGMPGIWKWYPDEDERMRPGGPDWLKSLDGSISPDGKTFID